MAFVFAGGGGLGGCGQRRMTMLIGPRPEM
jgi:hypothetical protein